MKQGSPFLCLYERGHKSREEKRMSKRMMWGLLTLAVFSGMLAQAEGL